MIAHRSRGHHPAIECTEPSTKEVVEHEGSPEPVKGLFSQLG